MSRILDVFAIIIAAVVSLAAIAGAVGLWMDSPAGGAILAVNIVGSLVLGLILAFAWTLIVMLWRSS